MTSDRKGLGEFQHPKKKKKKKITLPKPLLPPPNPGDALACRLPPGSPCAAPLRSGTARQSGTGVPCGAQSWRYAGNTPTSRLQDHTIQECGPSCFLLLNAAGGGGDSGAGALRSCNNLGMKARTQEVGQWALGPPQPQGFRGSISHETTQNPELSGEGEVRGMGRRGGESIYFLIQAMPMSREEKMKEPWYPKVTFERA